MEEEFNEEVYKAELSKKYEKVSKYALNNRLKEIKSRRETKYTKIEILVIKQYISSFRELRKESIEAKKELDPNLVKGFQKWIANQIYYFNEQHPMRDRKVKTATYKKQLAALHTIKHLLTITTKK